MNPTSTYSNATLRILLLGWLFVTPFVINCRNSNDTTPPPTPILKDHKEVHQTTNLDPAKKKTLDPSIKTTQPFDPIKETPTVLAQIDPQNPPTSPTLSHNNTIPPTSTPSTSPTPTTPSKPNGPPSKPKDLPLKPKDLPRKPAELEGLERLTGEKISPNLKDLTPDKLNHLNININHKMILKKKRSQDLPHDPTIIPPMWEPMPKIRPPWVPDPRIIRP